MLKGQHLSPLPSPLFLPPTYFIPSPMHLYVHVPFCKRRCSYCDFAIAVRKQVPGDEFVEAIKREFALRHLALSQAAEPLETLYFGGGTPSLLSSSHVAALIRSFREEIGFAERGTIRFPGLEKPIDPYRTRTCP